jgi:predicted nucleic acid-binding protein
LKRFVLDASVTLAWLIDRSMAPYAVHVRRLLLLGSRAVVPALWQWEIANGIVMAERRAMLTANDTIQILQNFEIVLGNSIEIQHGPVSIRRVTATARQSRLTAYDAAYLDLAKDHQLPLATLDRGLAEAAKQAGVPLVP